MIKVLSYSSIIALLFFFGCSSPEKRYCDVLVIGGSASGATAAIQSARMGATTLIVEETTWLGGMVSAAGVSAFDGNHNIPSGLWNEFRDSIYNYYGGAEKVATGWVSNTHFEPHVADRIFKSMASNEKNLSVMYGWKFDHVIKEKDTIKGAVFINSSSGQTVSVHARVVIDATELGDVMADADVAHDIGMEPQVAQKENIKVGASAEGIIQDMTYVAILKDYGRDADCTIAKPANYFPEEFDGACIDYYHDTTRKKPAVDAITMLNYAKLPNGKYMINWPNFGNDYYFNPIPLRQDQRDSGYDAAKEQTKRFVYFIQHQLGFRHLGLADDEFPTADRLALIPYHRESRRIRGLVRFDMVTLSNPYGYGNTLYRTGIAVGDYPIDHHHKKNPGAPQQLDFYPVPSFSIPFGTLIPQTADGIIAAEKNISVSNVINGATRLQPVVMLIGQAAGALAALSVSERIAPRKVGVRQLQKKLLDHGAMLIPYFDVNIHHPQFSSIQRIGLTGILQGKGVPYKWANQTWFYPDRFVSADTLMINASGWLSAKSCKGPYLTIGEAEEWVLESASTLYGMNINNKDNAFVIALSKSGLEGKNKNDLITRGQFAVLLDLVIDPFTRKRVNYIGEIQSS